ncbi:hypothetical protein KM043_001035 [Ampulex compressa]|nr:hypothetical protein KM043_001035 [Ampulex compressa]
MSSEERRRTRGWARPRGLLLPLLLLCCALGEYRRTYFPVEEVLESPFWSLDAASIRDLWLPGFTGGSIPPEESHCACRKRLSKHAARSVLAKKRGVDILVLSCTSIMGPCVRSSAHARRATDAPGAVVGA